MMNRKIKISIAVILFLVTGILVYGLKDSHSVEEAVPEAKINPGIEIQNKQAEAESISFFAEYRMERERTRSKQIELLHEIISQTSQGKAREAASLRLVSISEDMEKEMKAENLVKSRGYKECVVIIQPHVTTVVLQASTLKSEQEDEIKQLVGSAIELEEDKISIITRK